MSRFVFLGGSCNPTTWRQDIAIPKLRANGVAFHNPQVADWNPDIHPALERKGKDDAAILLFVIDTQTRSIASMIEAASRMHRQRVVIAFTGEIPDGAVIAGQTITGRELADLNAARTYLRDEAKAFGVPVFDSVDSALDYIIAEIRDMY